MAIFVGKGDAMYFAKGNKFFEFPFCTCEIRVGVSVKVNKFEGCK